MRIHKREAFGKKKQHLAVMAKAIAHPARISILRILAKREHCNCNEIVKLLPLSQATVSQHLKELKTCGLIDGTVKGPSNIYTLNKITLKEFEAAFKKMMKAIHPKK
jgi:ArsR family transcriptional regulator, arsenate/arsenite/antimonite-responsive transcriptional repressor